ncbi:hypothetical protein [Albidovulum sp.]
MAGSSKILTVSYGTFSCTLEGFDDPFSAMKAIAEYFRDLAAKDRYFGAEPPTPDLEVLDRIAQDHLKAPARAKVDGNGIHLSRSEDRVTATLGAAAAAATPAAPPADLPPAGAERAPVASVDLPERDFDPDSVAAKLERLRAVVAEVRTRPAAAPAGQEEAEEPFEEPFEPVAEPGNGDFGFALDLGEALPVETRGEDLPAAESVESAGATEAEAPEEAVKAAEDDGAAAATEAAPHARVIKVRKEETAAGADETAAEPLVLRPDETAEEAAAPEIAPETVAETVAETAGEPEGRTAADGDDLTAAGEAEDTAEPVEAAAGEAEDTAEPVEAAAAETEDTAEPVEAAAEEVEQAAEAVAEAPSPEPVAAADEAEADPEDRTAAVLAALSDQEQDRFEEEDEAAAASPQDATEEEDRDLIEGISTVIGGSGLEDEDEAELLDELSKIAREVRRGGHEGRAILERTGDEGEASVERLMEEAKSKLEGDENRRRFSAIAHLKAAVAATVADRKFGFGTGEAGAKGAQTEEMARYREDLSKAVRPRRPAIETPQDSTRRPAEARPAPLILVSEQRVDIGAEERARSAIRPQRIATEGFLSGDEDEDAAGAVPSPEDVADFAEFAERLGATSLPELLEAAAAYTQTVEGQAHFSRPQILKKIMRMSEEEPISREDGLRTFGMLLREGKIQKAGRGQFTIAQSSKFIETARSAAR